MSVVDHVEKMHKNEISMHVCACVYVCTVCFKNK